MEKERKGVEIRNRLGLMDIIVPDVSGQAEQTTRKFSNVNCFTT